MEQPMVWDLAKWAAGALGLLILVFAVLRPALKNLAEAGAASQQMALAAAAAEGAAEAPADGEDQLSLTGGAATPQLAGPGDNYEGNLAVAQKVVTDDPKRVAQVVKNWVNEDG